MFSLLYTGIREIRPRRSLLLLGPRRRAFPGPRGLNSAFTLVELLVVISIILILMALLVPAFTGIKGGTELTKAAYEIAGILDNARTYAMANNTFTWVGFFEEDPTVPATTPAKAGTGRIVVASVASKDGTRGYDITASSLPTPWSNYPTGANLVAISKLQKFENLHLAPLFSSLPNSGGLSRPTVSSSTYQIGNTGSTSVTPIYWPPGSALGTCQYAFTKVINFNPQGTARIQTKSNQDGITRTMDIGLIPTHGNVVPSLPVNTGNCAAVQVNAMVGSTRIYRP